MGLAYAESADPTNLGMAKEILEDLHHAYPNHSWWVRIDGGLVIIKNFAISGTIGMVRRFSALSGDAMVRKRDVIRAAGELLERANLPRAGYQGQDVLTLERDKDVKWQPLGLPNRIIH